MTDFEEVEHYITKHFDSWKDNFFSDVDFLYVTKTDIKRASEELREVQTDCYNHLEFVYRTSNMSAEQFHSVRLSLAYMFSKQLSMLFDLSLEVK